MCSFVSFHLFCLAGIEEMDDSLRSLDGLGCHMLEDNSVRK